MAVELNYQPCRDRSIKLSYKAWRVGTLIAMLPALIVPFLPFACDTSPTQAASNLQHVVESRKLKETLARQNDRAELGLDMLSIAFFIAFAIVAWKFRGLFRNPFSTGSLWFPRVVGITGFIFDAAGLILLFSSAEGEFISLWTGAVLLLLTVWLCWLASRRPEQLYQLGLAFLLGPYAVAVSLNLLAFRKDPQQGYLFSILPDVCALAELLVIARMTLRNPAGRHRRADACAASPEQSIRAAV